MTSTTNTKAHNIWSEFIRKTKDELVEGRELDRLTTSMILSALGGLTRYADAAVRSMDGEEGIKLELEIEDALMDVGFAVMLLLQNNVPIKIGDFELTLDRG